MPHLTTIALSQNEYDTLLLNLRRIEHFAIEIDELGIAETLYAARLTLQHNADSEGAITSHNPTLD
jgi:hypothetical protein